MTVQLFQSSKTSRVSHRCWEHGGMCPLIERAWVNTWWEHGGTSNGVEKYLWRSKFVIKVAGYKSASLQIYEKRTSSHIFFKDFSQILKVVSTTFLLVCFACLKESTCEARETLFLFHFESSFHSWDNQFLSFQISECHDAINCLSMKHETHHNE